MINVVDISKCCGCGACAQRCPHACIELKEDNQGFLYPIVDLDQCVDCHLCEKVCPFLCEKSRQEPINCFASASDDQDVRHDSSSGGVFSMLAMAMIEYGGVVFGARFDERWAVVHDYTDCINGLGAFRGSKYVQSVIGDSFVNAEQFLKQEKMVLFSGTPCQIDGLKRFLGKEYDNLITVEVVCHGVPSPKVWKEHLRKILNKGKVTKVNFRDKTTGWRDYSVRIGNVVKRHDYDHYMGCFLANYSLRPSCFNCPSKSGASGADIILGDLWGIHEIAPSLNDDKGTSLVIVNTEKGMAWLEKCHVNRLASVRYEQAVTHNQAITRNSLKPGGYDMFWQVFEQNPTGAVKQYGKRFCPSMSLRLKQWISRSVSRIIPK